MSRKRSKAEKKESHSQSSRAAKAQRAKTIGTRDHLSQRFVDRVRSQMFHRK